MIVTDALMPVNSFLPVPLGVNNRAGEEFRYVPDRSRVPVVFEVYSPDDSSGLYGSDGEEIIMQKTGKFISCYV